MVAALVGAQGAVTAGTNSVTAAFGQATTAAHLLVAWVVYNPASGGVSTSAGGWLLAAQQSAINVECAEIWYKPNCSAGETAPTFVLGGSPNVMVVALAEFSGVLTSSPLTSGGGSAGGGNLDSPLVAPYTGAAAVTDVGQLVVTAGGWLFAAGKAGTGVTADTYTNGTPTGNLNNDATSTVDHYRMAWGLTANGSTAAQVTETQASMNSQEGRLVQALFGITGGGATRVPRRSRYPQLLAQ